MKGSQDRLLVIKYLVPTVKFCFSSYGFFAVNFIASIFLARLISPENFGVFALLLGVREILTQLAGFSRSQGYILSDGKAKDFDVAFSLSAIALVVNLCVGILCSWLAIFFDKPEYSAILFWLFFGQGISTMASIYAGPLEKQLSYVKLSIIKNAPNSLGLFAAIYTAIYFPSIWCLLLRELVISISALCLAYIYFQRKPKLTLNFDSFAMQASFNVKFTISRLFEVVYMRLPEILLPIVFGPFFSGICFQSRHFSYLAVKVPNTFLEQTLFSSLVSLNRENLNSKKYALLMAIFGGRVALLILIPFIINIESIINFTIGKQWIRISDVFQYFSIFAFFMTQFNAVQAWQLSLGFTKGISIGYTFATSCFAILMGVSFVSGSEIYALVGISSSMALALLVLCLSARDKFFTATLATSCVLPVATILLCINLTPFIRAMSVFESISVTFLSCFLFFVFSIFEFKFYGNLRFATKKESQ